LGVPHTMAFGVLNEEFEVSLRFDLDFVYGLFELILIVYV